MVLHPVLYVAHIGMGVIGLLFPEAVRETFVLAAPVVMVILLMVYWLIRVLFTGWYRAVRP